jgi:hypothetical protein
MLLFIFLFIILTFSVQHKLYFKIQTWRREGVQILTDGLSHVENDNELNYSTQTTEMN